MSMLDAFKIKPFDLEPVYASWSDAPRFHGKPKKDVPVDEWLAQIKAGCIERKVPREYWHKVAQHYLADKALARFEEVKVVMRHMHGGKYRWTWKTFKVAMRNMGWDIDSADTESIEVQSKPSGLWWIVGRRKDTAKENTPTSAPPPVPPKAPQRSKSVWEVSTLKSFPMPKRSATVSSVETISSIASASSSSKGSTPVSTPATTPASTPGETTTTITHAPLWLLNACQSLDYLTNEHPTVMTALSAVLITVGSLPALPAISAGAGGAFLASGTAHAIGSIAVGLGTWLKAQNEGQAQIAAPPAVQH
ncbi:hypothetical protein B0H21DRAFT_825472 [Amylocystis lapponica]|nr:hypothetical protein B0H21DRAFT_825472 [Amylocystis lapponica]